MPLFHGWVVVAATHVALLVIFGVGYSFAAFFSAFQEEFGASRGDISLVFSIFGFLYFMVGAFTGVLADRVGPRIVCVVGMLLLVAGLVVTARAPTLELLYVAYSVGIGLGVGCVYVPAVSAVQPWFVRRRSLATGIAVAGIGAGTLLGPIVGAWLIGEIGWRRAYDAFAVFALVVGGGAALLIDRDLVRRRLHPDGERPRDASPTPRISPSGVTLPAALRTHAFWLLYAVLLACGIGLFVPMVHLAPYARDHGHTIETGALLTGLIGLGSIIGRFGLAGFGDRIRRTTLLAVCVGSMGVALLIWLVSTSFVALAAFAILFGTGYGGMVAAAPSVAMDYFGGRSLAGIIGAVYTGPGIGIGVGPWLAGVAFDVRGDYTLPIIASAALMFVAAGAALGLARQRELQASVA